MIISDDFLHPRWITDEFTSRPYFLVRCAGGCRRILKTRGDPTWRFKRDPLVHYPPLCTKCRNARGDVVVTIGEQAAARDAEKHQDA